MATKYRLRLKRLDFISAVDAGAQGAISNVALLKRAPDGGFTADVTCNVIKLDESLGLVFGWALATTLDGGKTPHVDLQNDAIHDDHELIKVAAEFMEAAASSDVMHDFEKDGRIVFAMPLVPEINTALGIKSDVHGLAIAMRPSPETFKRFVSKELNGFSIAGIGEREPLESATKRQPPKAVAKRSLLTSAEEGHSHLLDDGDGAGAGYTSCECMGEGMTATYHSHPWSRDDAGNIVIGMSAGHTHVVLDPGNTDEATVEVEQRAPIAARKSPPSNPLPTTKAQPETKPMIKFLPVLLAMTASQQAHVSKLAPDEVEPFLAKPAAERDAIFKAADAADEVIFKGEVSGIEVRKSDGAIALQLAKQNEQNMATIAKQTNELTKANARTETVELEKRAGVELYAFGKSVGTRAAILKAIDGIADEAVRKDAIEALKGANAALSELAKSKGVNPGEDAQANANAPIVKFEAARVAFAKAKHKTEAPTSDQVRAVSGEFVRTPEGGALYADAYPAHA